MANADGTKCPNYYSRPILKCTITIHVYYITITKFIIITRTLQRLYTRYQLQLYYQTMYILGPLLLYLQVFNVSSHVNVNLKSDTANTRS